MGNNPSLRLDLDFIPFEQQGRRFFAVHDRLGLVAWGTAVPAENGRLLALLDGSRTVHDLRDKLTRMQGGVLVSVQDVEQLLAHLDHSYLLNSERYREARAVIVADFAAMDTRPCALAGSGFPDDPGELARLLDDILAANPSPLEQEGALKALVAPHIDLDAGRAVYARAYNALRGQRPERVVVLGVGHQMATDMFSLSAKTFSTPLGKTPSDAEAAARLREAAGDLAAEDDFAHRFEHSIEFQALFLQRLLGPDAFTLVPVLCGSLSIGLEVLDRLAYQAVLGPFLDELRDMLAEPGTLAVAGVDFCHIGPKFGHAESGRELEAAATAHDAALLEALAAGDADAFWAESARLQDRYNVCGLPALACLLEILPDCQGAVLGHHVWHEPPTKSAVSFAAAAFRARD